MGEINEVEIGMENENNQSSNPKTTQKIECLICRNFFKPNSNAQRYCSQKCFKIHKKTYMKEYHKKYYEANKEKIKMKVKTYRQRPEIMEYKKIQWRAYYQRPEVQEKMKANAKKPKYLAYKKAYMEVYHKSLKTRMRMREYMKIYVKNRRKTDFQFYIQSNLKCLFRLALKKYGNGKTQSSKKYDIVWDEAIKKLIETKPLDFNERKYHIDHIRPLSSFDLTDLKQIKQAFAPGNLQWLEATENIRKGNKTL